MIFLITTCKSQLCQNKKINTYNKIKPHRHVTTDLTNVKDKILKEVSEKDYFQRITFKRAKIPLAVSL